MTYCCGLLTEEGLAMICDTRTNAGVDNISTFKKLHVVEKPGERVFMMATAGNLSVTQSALSLLQEGVLNPDTNAFETLESCVTMFRAARLVGAALKQVTDQVSGPLSSAGVDYGATILLGGQIAGSSPALFMIYGVGNFIECGPDAPFMQIGEAKYGKPTLDRFVTYSASLADAVKLALISFDSTIRSNLAVGAPLDVAVMRRDALRVETQHRVRADDPYFRDLSHRWSEALRAAAADIPCPPFLQPAPAGG